MKKYLPLVCLIIGTTLLSYPTRSQSTNNVAKESDEDYYAREVVRSVDRLLAVPKLRAFIPDCDFKTHFEVIGFEAYIQAVRQDDQFFVHRGSQFSPAFISSIQTLKRGDRIYFDHIQCVGEDKLVRRLKSKVIIIQ